MGYRRKTTSEKVPPEVSLALRFGKLAYKRHPSWDTETPDQVCLEAYVVCGRLIHDPAAGPQLWAQHRRELLKRPDISKWWGYREFEKGSNSQRVDSKK